MYPEDDLNVQGIKPDKLNLPMSAIPSPGFFKVLLALSSIHIEVIYITSISAMGKGQRCSLLMCWNKHRGTIVRNNSSRAISSSVFF